MGLLKARAGEGAASGLLTAFPVAMLDPESNREKKTGNR